MNHIMKGLISLAVMLMFTVAFISGQARATLPSSDGLLETDSVSTNAGFDRDSLRRLDSLTHLIDLILALPIDVEIRIGDLSIRNDAAHDAQGNELTAQ
ncbi:MAG: hypothetical protein R3192_03190 [Woeseiaceae bacterium]|nr:hypothetical protein [Woeseiaceae bacterium]